MSNNISKVMTLNLCQKMIEPRLERFKRVADHMIAEQVDVLLFQEGSGGLMDETFNSPKDLCRLIKKRGVPFYYIAANNLGAWGFLTFKVGIASRFPFDWAYAASTGKPEGDWFDTLPLPFRRNIVAVGIGDMAFISTHFNSGADKLDQVIKLLRVINDIVLTYGVCNIILGGDFNFGRGETAYQTIRMAGFSELAGAGVDFIFGRNVNGLGGVSIREGDVSDHPAITATIN